MPCRKCGAIRLISKSGILCPNCDGIRILDTNVATKNRIEKLKEISSRFSKDLQSANYNFLYGSAIANRELAAKAAILLPQRRTYFLVEWFAYTHILRKLKFIEENDTQNLPGILHLSRNIVQLTNEILCLQQKHILPIQSADKEILEFTELEPLSFIPEDIVKRFDLPQLITKQIGDEDFHLESTFLKEIAMSPIHTVLLSEDISRKMRFCYHYRILPFIKSSTEALKFVNISFKIFNHGLESNLRRKVDKKFEGIILANEDGVGQLKRNLIIVDGYSSDDVEWYFDNLLHSTVENEYSIHDSIIVRDQQKQIFCIPLFSLWMLGLATMKWMKAADLGRALNYKGEIVEEYFFRFMSAYNLSLIHPITGEPLLRVKHPDSKEEIADIIGHNQKYVLVMECKFWSSPTLAELERELVKYKKRVTYIRDNLTKFGFCKESEVISIFYTPYAPYVSWNGIKIFPTAMAIGMEITKLFGTRKYELVEKSPELEQVMDLTDAPIPFPLDASVFFTSLPSNKYRVHDGIVLEYDESEITVFIDLPTSTEGFFVYLDISKETFAELKQKRISPGDILRMIVVNLNGTWTISQLMLFKRIMKLSTWKSNPEKVTAYRRMIELFEYFQKKEPTG